jgi:hypothetical protein
LHDHPWVHFLVDEEALCEPMPEVVTGHLAEVFVASLVGGGLGGPGYHRADAPLGQLNERIARGNVPGVLVTL